MYKFGLLTTLIHRFDPVCHGPVDDPKPGALVHPHSKEAAMPELRAFAALILSVSFSFVVAAQVGAPESVGGPVGERVYGEPLRIVQTESVDPAAALVPADRGARDQLDAMTEWNRAGRRPYRNGFARPLPRPIEMQVGGLSTMATADQPGVVRRVTGEYATLSTSVRVEQAHRLRLHLSNADLPRGAVMWVWGERGDVTGFDLSLLDQDGTLWTPSASGSTIYFECRIPVKDGAHASIEIDRVMEIVSPGGTARRETDNRPLLVPLGEVSLPACTLSTVSCGSNRSGVLDNSDCEASSIYIDVYRITLQDGQGLSVTMSATGSSGEEVFILLFDEDLTTVLGEEVDTGSATLHYGVTSGRTLMVGVGFNRTDGFGNYSVEFSCSSSCLRDASCETSSTLSSIADYRRAVAHLQFVVDDSSAICTGALLADTDSSTIVPYMLTANHCFSTQAAASSLEAYFDYRSSFCNGSDPDLTFLPRSSGASMLATSSATDFTLVELNSIPANRFLLGWDANSSSVTSGTMLYRISHPLGLPQAFSRSSVTSFGSCEGIDRPNFIYSSVNQGKIAGGSSGSPMVLSNGAVVGQLLGLCGPDPDSFCNSQNLFVDGAFSRTFPSVSSWLDPDTSGPCEACVPGATTACLLDGRFKVQVTWRNQFFVPVTEGVGSIIGYAENLPEVNPTFGTISEIGFFSMFPFAPTRVELVVKLISGVNINDHFWVYVAGMVNNEYTVTVTDTETCAVWQRSNPHNTFQIITDQRAFPFP